MNAENAKSTAAKSEPGASKAEVKSTTAKKTTPTKPSVKPAAKSAVKTAAKKVAVAKKPKKEGKFKVVRDSFTMPQPEYQKIADIKAACLKAGLHVKKSEVLRAGLQTLAGLNLSQLKGAFSKLDKIPTGRPKKH